MPDIHGLVTLTGADRDYGRLTRILHGSWSDALKEDRFCCAQLESSHG